jgi:uncharacterized protein involved in exopolysaccharide biosynthesis
MSISLSPARRSVALHESVEVAWRARRYSIAWIVCLLALSTAAAVALSPKYVSNATLLLMLGPEYTVRSNADEPNAATNSMDADHITASETAILSSGDLHRQVLKEIGLEKIYPDYVHPGPVKLWIKSTKARIAALFSDDIAGEDDIDPVEWALAEFDSHLSLVASRQGNVITLSFGHENPAMARKVLSSLIDHYLAFRRVLYSNEQSDVLATQAQNARLSLEAASRQLADFHVESGVADYGARLAILQHEQGDAENDASEAASQTAQNQARVSVLTSQLALLRPTISGGSDTDVDQRLTPLRTTLDAVRAKRAEAQANYTTESAVIGVLDSQVQQREAELAAGRRDRGASASHTVLNTVYQGAQSDLIKARADLTAAQAREAVDRQQLVSIGAQIQELQLAHRRLEDLERQRDVFDDNYRATTKIVEARQNSEQVEARKLPSVRLAQTPDFPLKPKPTRLIILILGLFASVAGAIGIPVLINLSRRSFILRESLERDLALPVLACLPPGPERIRHRSYSAHLVR